MAAFHNISIYDVYGNTMTSPSSTATYKSSRTTHVYSMSPDQYLVRFKSKPTGKPAVVGLDISVPPLSRGSSRASSRLHSSHFPPSSSRLKHLTARGLNLERSVQSRQFEIAPIADLTTNYYDRRNSSNIRRPGPNEVCARRYPFFSQTYPNAIPQPHEHPIGGDLSYLPRPRNYLARRDIPWVYRYKVKRNMNQLSRIMGSGTPLEQNTVAIDCTDRSV